MSETTNVSLSPRAIAARSQITAIKQQIDKNGMAKTYTLVHEIFNGLDVFERQQVEDIFRDIYQETPEQARKNACDFLRKLGLRPVALALENAQLDLSWVAGTISEIIAHKDVPKWVCEILQERLDATQTAIIRATEAANPRKSRFKTAPKNVGNARDRISSLLDQMRMGRWVYNRIQDEFAAMNGESSTVSDLMELVEQEKVICLEKCRPAASSQLEDAGHPLAAKAIYDDFNKAEEVIKLALGAKNVHGWVKAILIYRLHQVREATRERHLSEQRTAATHEAEKLNELVEQIVDILDCATDAPVGVQQALLSEAKRVYDEAEEIQFFLPALEDVIAGKCGTDNFVTKLLQKDAELAKVVDLAPEGKKASALRWTLLNLAKDGISNLEGVVLQKTNAKPKLMAKKPIRPSLMQSFDDRRDCRNHRSPR